MSDSKASKLCAISSSLHYSIEGHDSQLIQFVMHPNKSIIVDNSSVCWLSDQITQIDRNSIFARMLGGDGNLSVLKNINSSCGIVALSRASNGPILGIDLKNIPNEGIVCFKGSFLCATEDISVTNKIWPEQPAAAPLLELALASRKVHVCSGGQGFLFLQSSSHILKKQLVDSSQSLIFDVSSLVAHDASCKVKLSSFGKNLFGSSTKYLTIEGPGCVYLSAHTHQQDHRYKQPLNKWTLALSVVLYIAVLGCYLYYYHQPYLLELYNKIIEILEEDR